MLLETILLIIVFFNVFLGLFILSQNPTSMINRLFLLVCAVASFWTYTNYLTTISPTVFLVQSTYATGAIVMSMGLLWVTTLTEGSFSLKRAIWMNSIGIFFCFLSFIPGFIVEYSPSPSNIFLQGKGGVGLGLYSLYYITFALMLIYKVYSEYRISTDLLQKRQYKLILIGSLITLILSAITSLIFPVFNFFVFAGVDNIGFLIFLIFITYSISKYRLFDITIIPSHIVVLILWMVLLIRFLNERDFGTMTTSIVLSITIAIFSILVIQNQQVNTRHRAEIEELTQELKKGMLESNS